MTRSFFLLALLLAGLFPALHAQPAEPKPREIRFLAWGALPEDLKLGRGPSALPLRLYTTALSAPVKASDKSLVELTRKVTDAEGRTTEQLFVSFTWPAGEQRVIAIVGTATNPAATHDAVPGTVLVMPDDPAAFPVNSLRVVNLSANSVAVRAGTVQQVLAQRDNLTATLNGNRLIRLDVVRPDGATWKSSVARNLPVNPGMRALGIIRSANNPTDNPSTTPDRLAFSVIYERLEADTEILNFKPNENPGADSP